MIPLLGALIFFLIGFIAGFTSYALMVKRAAAKGRLFMIDKDGHWNPFEPQPIDQQEELRGR